MRTISIVSASAVLLLSSAAWAHHNPGYWYLDEVVTGEFDGYEGSVGNTVNYIDVDPVTGAGEMELSACCNPDDCAGSGSNIYSLTWEIVPSASNASRGQTFEVHLTNDWIGGVGCPDIDPFISTCGQEGAPASQEVEQGIVLDYRSNSLTHAECNRFYTAPADSTFHVPSPHEVYFYDHENMPHDGYWWLNITHRWGMQYEIVYVYREDVALTGGPPTGGAGGTSGEGGAGGMDPGAGGTGPIDVADGGIDVDLPVGGATQDAGEATGGKPPGDNSSGDDGVGTLDTESDDAGTERKGGGGGGGCAMTMPAQNGSALVGLLIGALLLARRRRS